MSVTFNVCNASSYNNSHNVCSTLTVSTLNYMQCSSFALLSCYCFHSQLRPTNQMPPTQQSTACWQAARDYTESIMSVFLGDQSDWLRRAEQIRHSSNEPEGDCGQELLTTTGHMELCERLSVEFSLIEFSFNPPSSN